MTISTIADQIFRELGQPSSLTIASISFWLRANIGAINSLLNLSYSVDESTQTVSPTIGIKEGAIFQKLYFISYYDDQMRTFLGAAGVSTALEIIDSGHEIKMVNKNEISKTFLSLKRDTQDALNKLVKAYKWSNFEPKQVAGNEELIGRLSPTDA